jgi:hypothetical protein
VDSKKRFDESLAGRDGYVKKESAMEEAFLENDILSLLTKSNILNGDKRPVLITSFIPLQHIHFAAELEIVERLIAKGYSVYVLRCHSHLNSCFANPTHLRSLCTACKSTFSRSYKLIQNERLTIIDFPGEDDLETVTMVTLSERSSHHREIVRGAYSSAVSYSKDPKITKLKDHKVLERNLKSADYVFDSLNRLIHLHDFSSVVVFNGRFSESKSVIEACRLNNVPVFCHEISGSALSYRLFEGGDTHSLNFHKGCISNYLEKLKEDKDVLVTGAEFFEKQRDGKAFSSLRRNFFVEGQTRKHLPKFFDRGRKNIAVFISSEDEFAAYEEWANPYNASQFEALCVALPLLVALDFVIWIRLHPHLKGRHDNSQVSEMRSLKRDNVHIIEPDDEVDSYALIENCQNVITFGSTIGLESAYMGVNTILLGRAIYEDTGINRVPVSIYDLSSSLDLPIDEKVREKCLVVGAYLASEYNAFRHTEFSPNQKYLLYRNHRLLPRFFARTLYHLFLSLGK